MKISDEDHIRIAEAVARAEASTSGEIRCVLAAETENTPLSALMSAALVAFILPPLLVFFLGLGPDSLTRLFGSGTAAHLQSPNAQVYSMLALYTGLQAVIFALIAGLSMAPPLRRLFTPGTIVSARVRRAAIEQFEALGLTHTRDATGVLLFASLADHRAEVLADSGIYGRTTPADWQHVADALVAGLAAGKPADGFVAAVDAAGEILAQHFPRRDDDTNELPDGLVVRKRPS